ncbi:hypothetical protein [Immundisolibacter sp.]|uniref:hypothetical protein n=1 Tax=Immundisolibacter sp. TaxID=1934948 RepID=UPI003564DA36
MPSDNGITAARRLLLDAVRANQTRGAEPGLAPASHRCRAASVIVPQDALAPVVSVVLLGNASLKPACGILGFRHPRYVDT